MCEVADVDVDQDSSFWALFGDSTYQRQLGASIFFEADVPNDAWFDAAIQLAVVAGSLPFWRLPTAHQVQDWLLQAFIAETIAADGVAITKVAPELLTAGIAVTGSTNTIDDLQQHFIDAGPLDEVAVRHSVELGGTWPR